jgi:hypothetical protein
MNCICYVALSATIIMNDKLTEECDRDLIKPLL